MKPMRRREALATLGAVVLAGCGQARSTVTDSSTLTPAPNPDASTSTGTDRRLTASLPGAGLPAEPATEQDVAMGCDNEDKIYYFSPSLSWIEPGTTLRWGLASNCRQQSTAYHPDNGRPLRIPEGATPWQGPVMQGSGIFEHTFDTVGVYDVAGLFEEAGQVSTIVVGRPVLAEQPAMRDPGDQIPAPARENLRRLHEVVRTQFS